MSEEDVDARVRAARAILQTVIDKWHQDAPVSSALMKEEIIFEQPLDFGGFDQQSFNRSKSVQVRGLPAIRCLLRQGVFLPVF